MSYLPNDFSVVRNLTFFKEALDRLTFVNYTGQYILAYWFSSFHSIDKHK